MNEMGFVIGFLIRLVQVALSSLCSCNSTVTYNWKLSIPYEGPFFFICKTFRGFFQ